VLFELWFQRLKTELEFVGNIDNKSVDFDSNDYLLVGNISWLLDLCFFQVSFPSFEDQEEYGQDEDNLEEKVQVIYKATIFLVDQNRTYIDGIVWIHLKFSNKISS